MEKNKEKASTYLQFFEFLRILNLGLRICDVIDWVGAKITTMTKNPYFGKCMSGSIATSFFFYVQYADERSRQLYHNVTVSQR